MVAITMGERSFSKVLFIFLLLGGFFATKTVLANPVAEDDVQSDDTQAASAPFYVTKLNEVFEVTEGEKLVISCNIQAEESKHAFFWAYKNGTEDNVLFLDDKLLWGPAEPFYNVTQDHRLVILRVTPQTVGMYRCYVVPETFTTHEVRLKDSKDSGTRNYASLCVLVTVLVTLLNR